MTAQKWPAAPLTCPNYPEKCPNTGAATVQLTSAANMTASLAIHVSRYICPECGTEWQQTITGTVSDLKSSLIITRPQQWELP